MSAIETPARGGAAESSAFERDLVEGLSKAQKTLPCRYFYDARGSELFDAITRLPEYYPTRVETQILRECAPVIAARTPPGAVLVEFGSGSSTKTEILISHLRDLAAYVAIDVSASALEDARMRLRDRFPQLRVECVVGDFSTARLPSGLSHAPCLGFFPGSTIGNLEPLEAQALLRRFASVLGPDARLVIGVDVIKDPAILIPAYDDALGVTAAFNLNLLARANRELGADFDLAGFRHRAVWNEASTRIEMRLLSLADQVVRVGGRSFAFARGETIHTENSHKWPEPVFAGVCEAAGWRIAERWVDPQGLFRVLELRQGRLNCPESPSRLEACALTG
ncbi:MAG: L-histidine N(alpha)-methyltransferase [Beijerinckiaceae bacterium]|nr:L-histidine N(alpha)-methyltransferase [Beijerinckiaceae bacterium]